MSIVISTRNADKLKEIRAILEMPGLLFKSALDFPEAPRVDEDGDTLEANAVKKATTLAQYCLMWALADDTGLEVDALGGAPGVYAARYAGPNATYRDNVTKLLAELKGEGNRTAQFRTVIALSDSLGNTQVVDGACPGIIAEAPQGGGGFGYDSIFIPSNSQRTFAEMSFEEKNQVSHRAKALGNARRCWNDRLQGLARGLID